VTADFYRFDRTNVFDLLDNQRRGIAFQIKVIMPI
jgi:hypothetical protein